MKTRIITAVVGLCLLAVVLAFFDTVLFDLVLSLICLIGIFLVAVGVSLEVKANVVVLAGEGVVLAICRVLPVKFGYMKVGFDVTLVVTACVLSIVFTGQLQGVREGTVAAALLVGLIAKRLGKFWDGLGRRGDTGGSAVGNSAAEGA